MRRKDAFKRISAGLVLVLGVSLLSACESGTVRTVDYGDGGTTEEIAADRKGAKKGVEQFMGASAWKDEWKATDADGNVVTISVDTNITLPNAEQMYVVEVEETVFDEAYREQVAKALFGDGSVYYNDKAHWTKAVLQENYDKELELYNVIDDEEEMNYRKAQLDQYEELLRTAKDTYTPVDTYDVYDYYGERDGILYELSFWNETKLQGLLEGKPGVDYEGITISQDVRFNVKDESDIYTGASAGEENEFSEEAAKKQAEDLLGKLGLEYFICTDSKSLDQGYHFQFERGIDGTSFGTYYVKVDYEHGVRIEKKKNGEERRYDLRAFCDVIVTDKGIGWMRIENPIEITEISDAVEMLPLAMVQEIMEDKAINEFDSFRFDYDSDREITFNHMELIYFRIRDKEHEGRYSYVPAWRLTDKWRESRNHCVISPILINAIDGSVIDFYDEI